MITKATLKILSVALAVSALLTTESVYAAPIIVYSDSASSIISGVTGVYDAWSNKNYDVTFNAGSFNSLFSGSSAPDFSFITSADVASNLNQALGNSILKTVSANFEISGCAPNEYCETLTPINDNTSTPVLINTFSYILTKKVIGSVGAYLTNKSYDTTSSLPPYGKTYEVWSLSADQTLPVATPVPEPTEGALLLSGMGMLGFIASRRKESV